MLGVFISDQIQRVSVTGSDRVQEVQIIEALALPEGDPVYEVSVRGWGWQKEVQEIRAGTAPTSDETEIQASWQVYLLYETHHSIQSYNTGTELRE